MENRIATTIEQSKKLAEILPLESADMSWTLIYDENHMMSDYRLDLLPHRFNSAGSEPAWSLLALLKVMPSEIKDNHYLTLEKETFKTGDEYCCCYKDCNGNSFKNCFSDNPIDACYEMIIRLNELKIL